MGVSCATPTSCTAVGSGSNEAIVESWDGTAWTATPTPQVPKVNAVTLDAASCLSATNCVAVGFITDRHDAETALAESLGPRGWTAESTPSVVEQPDKIPCQNEPCTASGLSQVSCPNATMCIAVGTYTTSAGMQQPLVERRS
jgi:hypothetical protein